MPEQAAQSTAPTRSTQAPTSCIAPLLMLSSPTAAASRAKAARPTPQGNSARTTTPTKSTPSATAFSMSALRQPQPCRSLSRTATRPTAHKSALDLLHRAAVALDFPLHGSPVRWNIRYQRLFLMYGQSLIEEHTAPSR